MDDLLEHAESSVSTGPEERARRRRLWMTAVIAALSLFGLTSLSTDALFTDNDTAGSNSFTAGTVNISASDASTTLSATNMAPGDRVFAPVAIDNPGSLQFRYAVAAAASDPDGKALASQLRLRTWRVAAADQCSAAGTSSLAPLGDLAGLSAIERALVGDRTIGADPGDRTLSSGVSEALCFRVDLPLSTGNAFQGARTALTVRFFAEQTANH